MLLDRKHEPGAQYQIYLGRRHLPWLGCAKRIKLANQTPVLVIDGDRSRQFLVGDRCAAKLGQAMPQLGEFVDIVVAADVVAVILWNVEVADVDARKHRLPHAGQVANDVADRRKQHAVDEIEATRYAELDRRTRNSANIALIVGIAVDHLELVAAADDAERKHSRRVNDLARDVDRHVADHLATRHGGFPFARCLERQVLEQLVRPRDNARRSRSCSPMRPLYRPFCNEGLEAFHGVVCLHQFVEIEPLDRNELRLDARDKVRARRLDRVAQRTRALALESPLEIGERGSFPDRRPPRARAPSPRRRLR